MYASKEELFKRINSLREQLDVLRFDVAFDRIKAKDAREIVEVLHENLTSMLQVL